MGVACFSGQPRVIYQQARAPGHAAATRPDPAPGHEPKAGAATLASTTTRMPPPFSLTAPDGTGLTLAALRVEGVVDGPLALTELHMDFVNGEDRTIEGRFELSLPPGATITRFAMRVGGRWQEAEVVERQRGRQVYEQVLHQGLDPALLEVEAGNRFRARVFPIRARETKQLIVSYATELDDDRYTVPLRGFPRLGRLDIDVRGSVVKGRFERVFERYLPEEDLEVGLELGAGDLAFASEELVVARIVPIPAEAGGPGGAGEPLESLTILFDTSASRAVDFEAKIGRLEAFCAGLVDQGLGRARLRLIAFDQTRETVYEGALAGLAQPAFDRLRSRGALGATDLAAALAEVSGSERLILATDGSGSAGAQVELDALVEGLAERGVERVDVLVDGSQRDQDALAQLVGGERLAEAGQLIELAALRPAEAAAKVRRPTFDQTELELRGAKWMAPRSVRGLQPGEPILVFAELDKPRSKLRVEVSTRSVPSAPMQRSSLALDARPIERALLERSVVDHRLDALIAELGAQVANQGELAATLRSQIVELATRHRVLTPLTALLVLEDDAAYARAGIERDALAPILVVGEEGVTLERGRDAGGSEGEDNSAGEAGSTALEQVARSEEQVDERLLALEPEPEPEPEAYRSMQQLERRAERLVELERQQEQERRSRLLDLERMAGEAEAAAGEPVGNDSPDAGPQPPTGSIEGVLDPSQVERRPEHFDYEAGDEVEGDQLSPTMVTRFANEAPAVSAEPDVPDELEHFDNPLDEAELDARRRRSRSSRSRPAFVELSAPPRYAEVELRGDAVEGRFVGVGWPAPVLDQVMGSIRRCYDLSLAHDGSWEGRGTLTLMIGAAGEVERLEASKLEPHPRFDRCLREAAPSWRFPTTVEGRTVTIARRLVFRAGAPRASGQPAPAGTIGAAKPKPRAPEGGPVEGRYAEILAHLDAGELGEARALAEVWHELFPGDPLTAVGLGWVLAAEGRYVDAGRAFGGLVDLHPSRADVRRFAANLLEALPDAAEVGGLAIDCYARAVAARPDQPSGYRLLALAHARAGELELALETIEQALQLDLPEGRYAGVRELLYQDFALLAGVWSLREPKARKRVLKRTVALDVPLDLEPSTRFVLSWESDANDVDLHVYDALGEHGYYRHPQLASGGQLQADVTTGFGPEAFVIPQPDAYPYDILVDYYSRGSGGHGMGTVQVLSHDGAGELVFESYPFVVMREHSALVLAQVAWPFE